MPDSREPPVVIDLAWRVNRIDFSREDAHRYLDALPRRALEASIRERAARVRCPVHGQRVKLSPAVGASGDLHFAVGACCQELEALVARQLGYRPAEGKARPERN
jgi:hypothetical protein